MQKKSGGIMKSGLDAMPLFILDDLLKLLKKQISNVITTNLSIK